MNDPKLISVIACLSMAAPAFAQDAPNLVDGTAPDSSADARSLIETMEEAQQAADDETVFPRDLSDRISRIVRNIPIIENPQRCEPGQPDLRIIVGNIEETGGSIVADLHNDVVEDFLESDKVVLRVRVPARSPAISFCMPVPVSGTYAVAVYHDANDNETFDKGFLRIPRERFGMSNNPKFGLSTPDFEEAALSVPETGKAIRINLVSSRDILSGSN